MELSSDKTHHYMQICFGTVEVLEAACRMVINVSAGCLDNIVRFCHATWNEYCCLSLTLPLISLFHIY